MSQQVVNWEHQLYLHGVRVFNQLTNELTSRMDAIRRRPDARRNLSAECGWPEGEVDPEVYWDLYRRDPVANRVVRVMARECWRVQPRVYEVEESDQKTTFEQAWDDLATSLRGTSRYRDQQGNPIWEYLYRLDVLSRVGRYGVLLIATDDGLPLEAAAFEPSPPPGTPTTPDTAGSTDPTTLTLGPQGVVPYGVPYPGTYGYGPPLAGPTGGPAPPVAPAAPAAPAGPRPVPRLAPDRPLEKGNGYTPPPAPDPAAAPATPKAPPRLARRLLYLRAFPERMVEVTAYDVDPISPRYGLPTQYRITFSDPRDDSAAAGIGVGQSTLVHWTRVLHLADSETNEVYGVPAMEAVLNPVLDIQKVRGGSAEMYWQGALPATVFETPAELGVDLDEDDAESKEAMQRFSNGLQRFIRAIGFTVKNLSPTVVSPEKQIEVLTDAVCVQLEMPKRVFMGSERGQLASSQDADSWSDRVQGRRDSYVTPRIIVPFVDRLIMLQVLPDVEEFHVGWPDMKSLSEADEAAVALTKTQAVAAYVTAQGWLLMAPMDYLTIILGMEDDEAQTVYDNQIKHEEEKHQQDMDRQAEQIDKGLAPDPTAPPPGLPPGAGGARDATQDAPGGTQGGKGKPGAGKPPFGRGKAGGASGGGKKPFPPRPTANVANYHPDQPRDDQGRWTDGGGADSIPGGRVDTGHAFVRDATVEADRARRPHNMTSGRAAHNEYLRSLGHTDDTIREYHAVKDAWAISGPSQAAARKRIEQAVREHDHLGKLIADQAALENHLYDRYMAGHAVRVEKAATKAEQDFKEQHPDPVRYDRQNWPGAHGEIMAERVEQSRHEEAARGLVYRKGAGGNTVESWTSNPTGANFAPITQGAGGTIGTDRARTVADLRKEGYHILGGVVTFWGQQGESELTMYHPGNIRRGVTGRGGDVHNYDPDQPREPDGKFGSGGAAGGTGSKDPGARPPRPAGHLTTEQIEAHAQAMVKAHQADPHVQKLRAAHAEAEDELRLAGATMHLAFNKSAKAGAEATTAYREAKEKVEHYEEALRHEARRTMLLSFGVDPAEQPRMSVVNYRSNSAQGKAWDKGWDYLQRLSTKDGLGKDVYVVSLKATKGRAYYDAGTLHTGTKDGPEISVHEFGHHLERRSTFVQGMVKEFRAKNYDPQDDVPMHEKFPGSGYGRDEVGNPDYMRGLFNAKAGTSDSHAFYAGKTYAGGKDTEIVSMGLEQMYRDPVHFATARPDYFSVMVHALQGKRP